jgi:uncharacterized integral membrane protein (TIGR00697 family)
MRQKYKYLPLLSMLFLTIMFADAVLEYKPIQMQFGSIMASSLVFPFWFLITDIIAEIYDTTIAKRILWSGFICQLLLSIICYFLIKLHSPTSFEHQASFDLILGHLPRITFANLISILIAGYINIYLLTKWKALLNGKHFWLRSIGSSIVGEIIYSTLAVFLIAYHIYPNEEILLMILWSSCLKAIYTIIFSGPLNFVAFLLRKYETVDEPSIKPYSGSSKLNNPVL